ncbi:sugar phosphate isomerase/epimerase family protein [Streptomyces benahoarensis]|uniref:Sugar phosphate isomerase/epimerase n=1 Tax=Streptomyces benahoarensis TaxID=2595054 RepID=A0A553ZEH9_9ACTN|nr:sugar phosphate isomerase/epimerase family protein [Streptomyces benahoarensis]TSB31622.1 sugar phosphate isomerase/epimerase [Streptomyces benahoarensis]TSB39848.1 sugar phosphate isomerase/epimerase [Streptomyces benahoarensis]
MPAESVRRTPHPQPGPGTGWAAPGIRYAGIGDEAAPDAEGQLAALHGLGWYAVELRSVDGVALADLAPAAFDALAGRLAATGTDVVCVDSRIANWSRPATDPFAQDLAELRTLAARCATLGTRHVRVMSYPDGGLPDDEWRRRVLDRMTALTRLAEDHGLVLLHENCHGWAGTRADRMLALLDHVASPALRLLFDIGNGVPHGYDAPALLDAVIDHVAHVHVKDAAAGPDGDVVYTLPGHGESGVAACLTALARRGWQGTWSVEPHTRLRPHDGTDDRELDGIAAFTAYGRALERLVEREVRPAAAPAEHGGRP